MIAVDCNLCGANRYRVLFPDTLQNGVGPDASAFRCTSTTYGSHAQIVECQACGHVYANPVWDEEELLALYGAVEDSTYVAEREGRELTFAKHLEHLEEYVGPANGRSLLDVGAYIGVFVEVAAASGWDACGIEPSAWAVEQARTYGTQIMHGTTASPELADRQFDVVTLWDVIEHLADPKGELARVYTLLKPGGTVAVHTMDTSSPIARLMGSRWPWYMEMHVQFFSQQSLARLLTDLGYEVIWSGVQGRYLRLNYVATRLGGLNRLLGELSATLFRSLNLSQKAVPINFGDLFTIYARRPKTDK